MKRTIAILAIIASGCSSTTLPPKEQRCETYSAAYALYQASSAVRKPSEDEAQAAIAAAVFLRAYCGWRATGEVQGTKGGPPPVDANGVPIIGPGK